MTSLRCNEPIIDLEGESSIQLGSDLLGRTYPTKHIHYFDFERDYKPLFHVTLYDHVQMANAFLLYLLKAYLFGNRGQTISLRWLVPFWDFKQARDVNWSHACLAYLNSVMDTLSRGTFRQLAKHWKLLENRLFPFSHIVSQILLHIIANSIGFTCYLSLQIAFHILANITLLSCKLSSCKLFLTFLQIVSTCPILQTVYVYSILKNVSYFLASCICMLYLANCILLSCKLFPCSFLQTIIMLFSCKLSACKLCLCSLLVVLILVSWPHLSWCGYGPEGLLFSPSSSQRPFLWLDE